MKCQYRIEIGIRKGQARILLKEKVELEEAVLKGLVDVLMMCKPMSITKALEALKFSEDSTIESIEIRED